ncbi:hypothetical protein ACC695_39455, partial [Rhizobium ruizarguesonis]
MNDDFDTLGILVEKIDIIPWSQDPATFVVNALQPAEV